MFDEFLGVPMHPLAVHAPVVLIPLLAVVGVAVSFKAVWRERLSMPFAGLSIVMVALLVVARQSGVAAKEANNVFGNIDRHEDLANQTLLLAGVWLVLAVLAGVASFLDRRGSVTSLSAGAADSLRSPVPTVLWILATVALVATTVWLIRTGHAGSESRWKF
ncbi:MAG: DUF2231 domain-containing protein [Ilumatobacter sp.]